MDHRTAFADRLEAVRHAFVANPHFNALVDRFYPWFSIVREPPFSAMDADHLLVAAWNDPERGIAAWCAKTGVGLPPGMLVLLTAVPPASPSAAFPDAEVADYCVGRAAMRWAIAMPDGSGGLALPYALASSHLNMAWAGADDELAASPLTPAARAEVMREAERLARDPTSLAPSLDRGMTASAILRAATPVSLEACAHRTVRDLPIESEFLRGVAVIGRSMPQFAAEALGVIGNAGLVAAALADEEALPFDALMSMLKCLRPVFNGAARTGSTAAWMALLEAESRVFEERHGLVQPNSPHGDSRASRMTAMLPVVFAALASRADGHRIAAEWLNRLVWARALMSYGAASRAAAIPFHDALLDLASGLFRDRGWGGTLNLWSVAGGPPVIREVDGSSSSPSAPRPLPVWHDWLGGTSRVVPLATAARVWNGQPSDAAWLAEWLRFVCDDLAGDAGLACMADARPSILAHLRAEPLAASRAPEKRFAAIWHSAREIRLRYRFLDFSEATADISTCKALIRIGIAALFRTVPAAPPTTRLLAEILVDAVDEMRFCVPDHDQGGWSDLVGALTLSMAVAGLLDRKALGLLLGRYQGDDDCLAAAAANALASGVPADDVAFAFVAIGEEPRAMVARWADWRRLEELANRPSGGQSTSMLELLIGFCDSLIVDAGGTRTPST